MTTTSPTFNNPLTTKQVQPSIPTQKTQSAMVSSSVPAATRPGYYTGLGQHHPPIRMTNHPHIPKSKRNSNRENLESKTSPPFAHAGSPAGLVIGNSTAQAHPMTFSEFVKLKQHLDTSKNIPAAHMLVPNYQQQADLHKEKAKLHNDSLAMVAKWNNTIAGQRKIRLEALNEKARVAEEARLEVDRDWAQVKAAERQALIDRAKNIQYLEEARVRQLNSQALISQVLKERNLQIEYKNINKTIEEEESQASLQAELDRLKAADEEAIEMQRRVKQIILETAATNQQMSQARRAEQQREREELRVWFSNANARSAQELLDLEHQQAVKKAADTKELVETLNRAVSDKHGREVLGSIEDSELDMINMEINLIKESIARKRKETEVAMIRSRILRNEYVASLQIPMQEAHEKERLMFIHKMEYANQGQLEHRLQLEADKRKAETQKCLEAMNKNIADREQLRIADAKEAMQVRLQHEETARLAIQSAAQRKDLQAQTKKSFGETYRMEMAQHASRAMLEKQMHKKEYVQSIDAELQRDLEFHNYANKLISELKSINNDPTLVVRKLNEIDLDIQARSRYSNIDGPPPSGKPRRATGV